MSLIALLVLVPTVAHLPMSVRTASTAPQHARSAASEWNDVPRREDRVRASRSLAVRSPLPRVLCWNGTRVVDHPGRQDCPTRPRSSRNAAAPTQRVFTSLAVAEAWAHAPFAIAVSNCESGPGPHGAWQKRYVGDPHLRDGYYHGKWQMDPDFWASYGGLRYASDAADASEAEQDVVAYRGYLARGWEPWECAHLV